MKDWQWHTCLVIAIPVIAVALAIALTWLVPPDSVLAFVALVSTFFAAMSALGAWFTVREMRLDRIERTRPFVLADFTMTSSQAIYFVVSNLGNGVAREVEVSFDPAPVDFRGRELTRLTVFQNPIPILQPGAEIRQLFHIGHKLFEQEVPRTFKVTVNYRGDGRIKYTQTFDIDLEQYKDMTVPPTTIEEHLGHLVKQADKAIKLLKKVIWFNSLIVETPDQWTERIHSKEASEEIV